MEYDSSTISYKDDISTNPKINFLFLEEKNRKNSKMEKSENFENFDFFDFEEEDFEIINNLLFLINDIFEITINDSIFFDFLDFEKSEIEIDSFLKKSEKILETFFGLKKKFYRKKNYFLSNFEKNNFCVEKKFFPEKFLGNNLTNKKFKYY